MNGQDQYAYQKDVLKRRQRACEIWYLPPHQRMLA
jgi:hypothetical protein